MFVQFAIFVTILQLVSAQYGSKCCSSKSNFAPDYEAILRTLDLLEAKIENGISNNELLHTKLKTELNTKFDNLKATCCSKNSATTEPSPTEPVTAETLLTETTSVEPLSTETKTTETTTTETTTTETTTTNPARWYCAEALGKGGRDGVYKITIPNSTFAPFDAYCMNNVATGEKGKYTNGPWMIIQRRMDGSQDFYKYWKDFKNGFGDLKREFHMGLDAIHALTHSTQHELWIQMEDYSYNERWAYYDKFVIDNEDASYSRTIGHNFHGSVENMFYLFVSYPVFNTRDNYHDNQRCMNNYRAGWWYATCASCNLNGEYGKNLDGNRGIWWKDYNGVSKNHVYLKKVHMAIRPKQN